MKTQGSSQDRSDADPGRTSAYADAAVAPPVGFGFDQDDETWIRGVRRHLQKDAVLSLGTIGPFRVLSEIGRGGQGVVLKALDPRTRRTVALKRMSAGVFATPEMRARFEREVEAAASLDHPSVVTVYGTEEIDGQSVLVMQWIDGVPIDRWAAPSANPPSLENILEVFVRACDAVQHAHQRGVIHRDLKPTNILVDSAGEPHVLDFGLAKLRNEEEGSTEITQSGVFLGTPSFAAPEQLRGDVRNIDVRTDVFALGQVLHLLLEGTPAYAPQAPIFERLRLMEAQFVQPTKTLRLGARGRELSLILATALRFRPEERYSSVANLAADLQRFMRGEALEAHPPSVTYRIGKFARRHRVVVSAASAIAIVLTAATAVSTSLYFKAEKNAERANASAQLARDEAANARQVTEFVKTILLQTTPSAFRPEQVKLSELLESASRKVDQAKLRPEIEAELRGVLAEAFGAVGMYQASGREASAGLSIADTRPLPPLQHALLLMQKGLSQYKAGDLSDAEQLMTKALELATDAVGPGDVETLQLRKNFALVQNAAGRYEEAETNLLEILAAEEKLLGLEDEKLVVTLGNLLIVQKNRGRLDEALASSRRAARIADLHKDKDSLKPLLCALDSASLLNDLEQFADAKIQVEAVLPSLASILEPTHPHIANAWNSLGVSEAGLKHLDAARAAFAKALEVTSAGEADDASIAFFMNNQAHVLANAGDHPGALAGMEQALAIRRQRLPAENPLIADSLYDIGWEHIELKAPQEGLRAFQEATEINRKHGADRAFQLSMSLSGVGTALTDLQRWDEAQAALRECIEIRRSLSIAPEWTVTSVVRQLGWLEYKRGDLARARELLESSVPKLWEDPRTSPFVRRRAVEQLIEFYKTAGDQLKQGEWEQRLATLDKPA